MRTIVVTLFLVLAARAYSAELYLLDSIVPPGTFSNHAWAVSADGSKVAVDDGNEMAYVWTTGTTQLTHVPDLPGGSAYVVPHSMSADGNVVVGRSGSGSGGIEAVYWTSSAGSVGLGDLPGGTFSSTAHDVSADGSVVVGVSKVEDHKDMAFRWTSADGMEPLGVLTGGNGHSRAFGVSGDGSTIVGTSLYAAGQEAFRWTEADGMVGLGDLDGLGFISTANAASHDGSTIVGTAVSEQGTEAFRWTEADGMIGLGGDGGMFRTSEAESVSADGGVIVGYGWTDGSTKEGFVWTAGDGVRHIADLLSTYGLTGLDGYTFTTVEDVSADGSTLAGYALNSTTNKFEGWVLTGFEPTVVPVPATLWLLVSALGTLGWLRRRVNAR